MARREDLIARTGCRRRRGFTLIELMIVVVIVAILAAIAVPIYLNYVRESRRSSAQTALLDLASREERYRATNNSYTGLLSQLGYASSTVTVPGNGENYYSITVAPASSAISSYTATATPIGDQANDSCGSYTLTNTGVRTATGGSSCW